MCLNESPPKRKGNVGDEIVREIQVSLNESPSQKEGKSHACA